MNDPRALHATSPHKPRGRVLFVKGYKRCLVKSSDEARIGERIFALPSAFSGQLNKLDVKPIEGVRRSLWRLRIGDYRVIFEPLGTDVIVHRLERRDDHTYQDLDRIAVVRQGQGLEIVEVTPPDTPTTQAGIGGRVPSRRSSKPTLVNPLTIFSDGELSSIGLSDDTVIKLRGLPDGTDVPEVLATGSLASSLIELVSDMWQRPEHYAEILGSGRVPKPSDAALDQEELSRRVASPDSSNSLAALNQEEFKTILARPIEEWMFYPHPSQSRIAQHLPTGPSRIRGGPGTGKTVASLHRARFLVQEGFAQKVLVTTFVRALPQVWRRLFGTFAPQEAARITTKNIDSLVLQTVSRIDGIVSLLKEEERNRLVREAIRRTPEVRTWIASATHLRDEFDYVLAGRNIRTVPDYLLVERRGRGSRLPQDGRRAVLRAYECYRELMRRAGKTDFPHLRLRALELATQGRAPSFDAVIVDESQDLTEVGVRLLLALDRSEGHSCFMLVGDGRQSIYPGGFSLRSLGLDVRGRSFLLPLNWRNTQAIASVAEAVVGQLPVGDLEDSPPSNWQEKGLPRRSGDDVEIHLVRPPFSEEEVLVTLVEDSLRSTGATDISVLGRTNRVWKRAEAALSRANVATCRISGSQEGQASGVRVGTFPGSKGLEFKVVMLVGMNKEDWAIKPFWLRAPDDIEDHWNRELRTLFVAMTRARDRLVLVSSGEVPDEVERARPLTSEWLWA